MLLCCTDRGHRRRLVVPAGTGLTIQKMAGTFLQVLSIARYLSVVRAVHVELRQIVLGFLLSTVPMVTDTVGS